MRRLLLACASVLVSFAEASGGDGLRGLVAEYEVDRRDLARFFSIDVSDARLDRLDRFAQEWRARLDALDFAKLDADARLDAILLRDHLEHEAAERARLRAQLAEDAAFLPFRAAIAGLEEARRRFDPLDPQATAEALAAVAEQARHVAANAVLEGQTPKEIPRAISGPRALVLAGQVDELRSALDSWARHFVGFDPAASWWIEQPARDASSAATALAKQLRELAGKKGGDDDPLVGEPIGRERLVEGLARERIAYSPEELVAIGERELAWCDAKMLEEAKALGFDAVAPALAKVKANHVAPGAQDDLVLAQAREAIALLDRLDLVTIPPLCRETWRVDMMSESDQRVLPFAAYGGQCMVVNYASEGLSQKEKAMRLRDNNVHFTRIVTPHELIPGHHLQGFQASRLKPWRRPFATPFIGEGWCLYWEMRFLELGWGATPEDRLGIYFWRRHRAARIVVSLSYHLGTMQPADMIRFLEERVGMENSPAKGEVRRYLEGGYGPLYQCAYLLGGLQLRALQREAVGGGRFTERAFHDAVLGENSIPIELIRARLLDLPLDPKAKAAWRFADAG